MDNLFDSLVVADADFIASMIVGSWIIILVSIAGLLVNVATSSEGSGNEGGEEESSMRGKVNQFSDAYHRV